MRRERSSYKYGVPKGGLEPPCPCEHSALNAACLPISPLWHAASALPSGESGAPQYYATPQRLSSQPEQLKSRQPSLLPTLDSAPTLRHTGAQAACPWRVSPRARRAAPTHPVSSLSRLIRREERMSRPDSAPNAAPDTPRTALPGSPPSALPGVTLFCANLALVVILALSWLWPSRFLTPPSGQPAPGGAPSAPPIATPSLSAPLTLTPIAPAATAATATTGAAPTSTPVSASPKPTAPAHATATSAPPTPTPIPTATATTAPPTPSPTFPPN